MWRQSVLNYIQLRGSVSRGDSFHWIWAKYWSTLSYQQPVSSGPGWKLWKVCGCTDVQFQSTQQHLNTVDSVPSVYTVRGGTKFVYEVQTHVSSQHDRFKVLNLVSFVCLLLCSAKHTFTHTFTCCSSCDSRPHRRVFLMNCVYWAYMLADSF